MSTNYMQQAGAADHLAGLIIRSCFLDIIDIDQSWYFAGKNKKGNKGPEALALYKGIRTPNQNVFIP